MSDTRTLLSRISALRQRLEKVEPLPGDWTNRADSSPEGPDRLKKLEGQLAAGAVYGTLLDGSFRTLQKNMDGAEEQARLPAQLTARARRLLIVGGELLARLRDLVRQFHHELRASEESGPSLQEPLAVRYRETVALAVTALKTVQAYPDSPSAQLELCDGLEATLDAVAERTGFLRTALEQKQRDSGWVEGLADLLVKAESGTLHNLKPFAALAEDLIGQARNSGPLRFFQSELQFPFAIGSARSQPTTKDLALAIACHSLNVAQVMARLAKYDLDLRNRQADAVVAALLHDIGMLQVPIELYTHAGPLDDAERRVMENHTRVGGGLVARLLPTGGWLAEAVTGHHERLDGTGYPAGLREAQISPLVRLLAVCDAYAAMCCTRPYRPAREPRTALTDTILQADKNGLDRVAAGLLFHLGFYPVGSLVELGDGSIAVVEAVHPHDGDTETTARPVLRLLGDSRGRMVSMPAIIDLAVCEHRNIIRTLPPEERRKLLAGRYPELVW